MRRRAKPAKAEVEAKRPAVRKSWKSEGSTVRDLEKRLAKALRSQAEAQDQHTATSEVLEVIRRSPSDVQPVFEVIAENAARLCDAVDVTIFQIDSNVLRVVVHNGPIPSASAGQTRPLVRETPTGRAVLDRRTIHVADVQAETDEYPEGSVRAQRLGYRTILAAPLLRVGEAIGAIVVRRTDVSPFTDRQVALLHTFANQAAIAIENVRLFKEVEVRNKALTEALEQQTATAEIVRVISHSPMDLQTVLNAVSGSAARLCDASDAVILLAEGTKLITAAHYGKGFATAVDRPVTRASVAGRAVIDRAAIHVADVQAADDFPLGQRLARADSTRTALAMPLILGDVAIGALLIRRGEIRLFSDKQIALLKTFADQAVIAIENARLFNETKEALERQTATSEILRVISQSPTDAQPVFDTIVQSAVRLCDGLFGCVFRFDGELMHLAAHHNYTPKALQALQEMLPMRPRLDSPLTGARAILTQAVAQVEDVLAEPGYARNVAQAGGFRSLLALPMLHGGNSLGSIFVAREQPGPFSDRQIELLKTFADQAVIAIENVRLFNETKEALDQQTATAEILRVISSSPTDIQPVFEAIVRSAVRLCNAQFANVFRLENDVVHLAAHHNVPFEALEHFRRTFPQLLSQGGTLTAQAMRQGTVVHIHDVEAQLDVAAPVRALTRSAGYRTVLAVPILRPGNVVGAIGVGRSDATGAPWPFSDKEIALLQTFADQAVIAIENVRLFNETKEALDRQTATSEILRVISQSPTDVQPVFEAIVESAGRLCDGSFAGVFRFDGELMHIGAVRQVTPAAAAMYERTYPMPPSRTQISGRAVLTRSVVHVHDLLGDPEYSREMALAGGWRSALSVPMLQDGNPIGAINVIRAKPLPFSETQIALLKTFADQAVIAIENVRLFTELQTSNRELTTALDTQTATSDILRVISRSQTNVQPVFDAIVASAVRLLGAYTGALTQIAGDQIELAALTSTDDAGDAATRARFPQSLQSEGANAQAIRDRAPINIADAQTDFRTPEAGRATARARGYRSQVVVPLLRHDEAVGTITVSRREPGGFTDDEIALLKTFADQAVIAIENARLLTELQSQNLALTRAHAQVSEALEQQTATSEILSVISRSQTDVQPVFDTIAQSALRLCEGHFCNVLRYDGELLHLGAHAATTPAGIDALRQVFPLSPSRATLAGRVVLDAAVTHIRDCQADPEFLPSLAAAQRLRSAVGVPMLREGRVIGSIGVGRSEVRPFTNKQTALLQTFADQAVIAIENARLLTELQARTQELSRSVGELQALGEVGQAVSSSLDLETVLTTIVSRAVQLSGLDGGVIFEYDEAAEEFAQRAATDPAGALAEARRTARIGKGEGVVGRTAVTLGPVQVPDITVAGAYEGRLRETLIEAGVRAVLAVPMLREGHLIGCLAVTRNAPGDFPPATMELLRTFATQSALAIQNARLFLEIADKSHQLEVASQHKSEFLANMSHELRTPLNAIIGFSEVLTERMFGDLNEKQDEYLKDIYASGTHLLSLINDILDLSKIEAGRMELELTDFHLPQAIDNALILVRERAGRRGITLDHSVDERLGEIRGDERKVKQVLLNLLSNALKFTPEGGRVEVRAGMVDGMAEIAVTDTGVGIAPEDQGAIFEEFRQVGTADKKAEGTGLGLTLCRKFVGLHGGRIWVKSQLGAGSTFTFTIPVCRAD